MFYQIALPLINCWPRIRDLKRTKAPKLLLEALVWSLRILYTYCLLSRGNSYIFLQVSIVFLTVRASGEIRRKMKLTFLHAVSFISGVSTPVKESNIEIFNFVFLPTIAGELAALRPRKGLRLRSYSSFNFRHLWLHFLDAASHSRYMIELTASKMHNSGTEILVRQSYLVHFL